MIGPRHASLLAEALGKLLGDPADGTVAFVRCLPSEHIDALIASVSFAIPGWTIAAVVDAVGVRRITADQAVEQREDKSGAALLLIDPSRAGAGLDGIYSAGREISEAEMFDKALELARKPFWGRMQFLDAAVRRAEKLGRRRRLPPWSRFDFTVTAANEGAGRALGKLGLWPVACEGAPTNAQLDMSADLADRLLYAGDFRSVPERVRSLLLDNASVQEPKLERLLRSLAGKSPESAAAAIVEEPDLWLGPLTPGFASQNLRHLALVPWRDNKNALLKWSGLTRPEAADQIPRLVLDRDAAAKDRAQIVIRWTTEPDNLPVGAVDYRVTITAGEDVLVELILPHRDKPQQQVAIGRASFEDLEGNEKFEAVVTVAAVGVEDVAPVLSEPFSLEFGSAVKDLSAASGQLVRTFVEGAIGAPDRTRFEELTASPNPAEDKKGFINWTGEVASRGTRVFRPPLLREMEEAWRRAGGPVGRWVQVVRADGSPVGALEFVPLDAGKDPLLDRVREACRKLASEMGPAGLLGRVVTTGWSAADSYVNAWEKALEAGDPALALHGTIEVRNQAGAVIGLLVTPVHPTRFAWLALYDQVVAHARYKQDLSPSAAINAAKPIDSANFPFALPGSGGTRGYIFADVLGFHVAAMAVEGEAEPKAAIALLAACLGGGGRDVASSADDENATAIGREIRHYLDCYGGSVDARPDVLSLQAWRAGDGQTVARALGQALRAQGDWDEEEGETAPLCFTLNLFHAANSVASGRFLTTVGQRRRSGGQVLDGLDRWMTDTAVRRGGVLVPRLRWAKRPEPDLNDDAGWRGAGTTHLSLAFDLFSSRLETAPSASLGEARPLHGWGLMRAIERVADGTELCWTSFAPPEQLGESAPEAKTAGDRLRRVDRAIARATARALGGGTEAWPVLRTRLSMQDRMRLERLHARSDWVITLDRYAVLDYLDAPRRNNEVYERFVIDAVPDRADLTAMQLVTSTSNLDAVRDLVDLALADMGLSGSERNSRFLVGHLKALSGRLAIRLADGGTRTGELIALALMHANCVAAQGQVETWLGLDQALLIPVDEIVSHAPIVTMAAADGEPAMRADFIHVSAPARGPLEFRFVEVKYRQHLRTARQPDLLAHMVAQTGELRRRWHAWFFSEDLAPLERVVRRSQLAKLLRFYVERATRHRLTEHGHARLSSEIDQVLLKESYRPGEVDEPDVGYVFCPEHRTGSAEPLYVDGSDEARLWLFGPSMLPDEASPNGGGPGDEAARRFPPPTAECDDTPPIPSPAPFGGKTGGDPAMDAVSIVADPSTALEGATESLPVQPAGGGAPPRSDSTVKIGLGESLAGAPVVWELSIRSNPHLMVVGLPGMGKTTALINICKQLTAAGIAPIIFSYHDDIDEKLAAAIGPMRTVDFDGLGFNPLRVHAPGPTAHIDVAGTLRDIFASIFPDLGEIQLEELRAAIRQSYDDLGWGRRDSERPAPPAFRTFLDILRSRPKPNQNLLARLQELDDYGFFNCGEDDAGLLADARPTLVRVHLSTNDILQRAFAGFVLYSVYKDMFRRGVQECLTHAVIFDEAHRAAKLKLIPRLAKECRKYGLALGLASQGVRDFDPALFEAIASYLVLRVTEADARTIARNIGPTADQGRTADRMKALEPYTAFFSAGSVRPTIVRLAG
ncbi:ATP-binding protein [Methylobacterium sp. J-043]|nr:ATP-binding protein [Methylobacterium sp. J-043]